MRICITYGVITGGGCERRLGDIMRYLLDHGHEVWLLASVYDALGEAVLHGQCGVPLDRVRYWKRDDGEGWKTNFMQDWVEEQAKELEADLIDVQWHPGYDVVPMACPAVATIHGMTSIPPAHLFQGVISVEDFLLDGARYKHGAPTIHNWVNLRRFPFMEELGEGIAFAGRAFKKVNVYKTAGYYQQWCEEHGIQKNSFPWWIHGYGTSTAPQVDAPPNFWWHGFADFSVEYPKHRIVMAAAQSAMEAMAMGRHVICGQALHLKNMGTFRPEGCLVTPDNIAALERFQFAYRRNYEPTPQEVWADTLTALEEDRLEERCAVRAWIEERHSMETQIGKIVDYYEQVIGGGK